MVDGVLTEGDKELLQNIEQKIFEMSVKLVDDRRRLLDRLVGKKVTYDGRSRKVTGQITGYQDNTLYIKNTKDKVTHTCDLRTMDMSKFNLCPPKVAERRCHSPTQRK